MSSARFGSAPSSPEQDEVWSLREQLALRSKSLERTLGVRAEQSRPGPGLPSARSPQQSLGSGEGRLPAEGLSAAPPVPDRGLGAAPSSAVEGRGRTMSGRGAESAAW